MNELFSNERLIDYFVSFDTQVIKVENMEHVDKLSNNSEELGIRVQYKYEVLKMLPKKIYKDKDIYELDLESIFQMLPLEYVYLKKPKNKYFSLIFTNCNIVFILL